MRHLGLLALTSASLISHPAAADVTRCAGADADLHYHATDFAEMNGDTGWVPSGSPAQVRVTGRIIGETTVAMGMHPTVCWPSEMNLSVPGRTGAGLLDFAYGAELHLYAQIHTSVLGNAIDWEGEIPVPIPAIPTDLMLAGTTTFDPSATATPAASDTTGAVTVLSTNLIGNLIGITGISGGLHLEVTGGLTTSYRTTSLMTGAGEMSADPLSVPAPGAGYGAAIEMPLSATGRITYAPSLTFTIAFDVKILGIRVVNWKLFSVPMGLPSIDRDVMLPSDGAHIGLPKASSLAGARIDFSAGAIQRLAVHNAGEAPLMLEASQLPEGVAMTPVTIAPGADGTINVIASDTAVTNGTSQLMLTTNDPGQATVLVTLGRDIGGTGTDDGDGVEHAGCNTGAGGAGLIVALAALGLRRRRRR